MIIILRFTKNMVATTRQLGLNFKSVQVAMMYKNRIHTYTMGEDNMVSVEDLHGVY